MCAVASTLDHARMLPKEYTKPSFHSLRRDLVDVLIGPLPKLRGDESCTTFVWSVLRTLTLLISAEGQLAQIPADYPDTLNIVLTQGVVPVRLPPLLLTC